MANDKSLHPRINPLWDIPMGEQRDGIFSAVPPELLHQYGLGMEKYCFEYTWAFIKIFYDRQKLRKRKALKEEEETNQGGEEGLLSVKVEGQNRFEGVVKQETTESTQARGKSSWKGSGTAPQNKWTTELDNRISLFRTRHSDLSMPRSKFPIGSYNLPYLQSKEYKALLYQVVEANCVVAFIFIHPDDSSNRRG